MVQDPRGQQFAESDFFLGRRRLHLTEQRMDFLRNRLPFRSGKQPPYDGEMTLLQGPSVRLPGRKAQ